MEPMTLLMLAQGGAKAGTNLLGGVSSFIQSRDAAKNYKRNAELAMQQAKNSAAQERDKYAQLAGTQAAIYGASGVDVNEGSAMEQLAATEAEGEVSAMMALYSGEVEAANYKTQARLVKWAGRSSLLGSLLRSQVQAGSGAINAAQWGQQ